jgi:hypothetical protein
MAPNKPDTPNGPVDSNEAGGGTNHESTMEALAAEVEKEAVADKVVIAGDPEQIAEETAEVSPERRPGDPKTGPNGLRLEILAGLLIVLCFAVALGFWVNILAGVLAALIGILSIVLNPVIGAASQRAIDREEVAEHHLGRDPDTVVIRTTSKRKERREARTM